MKLLLIVLVAVAVGWVYRGDLPLLGHGSVGSAQGAERWLLSTGNPDMTGGTVLNGTVIATAHCADSSQPTGTVENPELSQQGVRSSWYQCTAQIVSKPDMTMCVGAFTGGSWGGLAQYTLAPGACRAS